MTIGTLSVSITGRVEILNFFVGLDLGGIVEQKSNRFILFQKYLGYIPNSSLMYVLLIVVVRRMGTLNLPPPLVLYDKSRL